MINPFAKLEEFSLMTENLFSSIDVASKEGLPITVQLNTIYKINTEQSRDIYINFRHNYEHILIKPYVESVLRDIISSYDAKALYSEKTREEIKNKVNTLIVKKLSENGIIVVNVLINKIILPSQLIRAIEEKLKTEQLNEQMSFTIEKQRKEIYFGLEKEKLEAERKVIEAQGIQDFQNIVSKGISQELLQWKGIEASLKLAESTNTKTVVVGGSKNGLPIMFNTN